MGHIFTSQNHKKKKNLEIQVSAGNSRKIHDSSSTSFEISLTLVLTWLSPDGVFAFFSLLNMQFPSFPRTIICMSVPYRVIQYNNIDIF